MRLGALPAALAALLLAAPAFAAGRAAEPSLEPAVKAAFVFNFMRYVEWPQPGPGEIVVGVLGDNVSWGVMDEALAGKQVAGRDIVMRRVHADEAVRCHVLVVPASAMGDWPAVRGQLAGRPVLTVGDARGFTEQGGVIGFVVEANKLRFEVNQEAAETAGLRLSSRLLSLARSVRRGAAAR